MPTYSVVTVSGRLFDASPLGLPPSGSQGPPDALSLGGSRELWCAGVFRASYFFVKTGAGVLPIEDRPLVLHRALAEAFSSLERLA